MTGGIKYLHLESRVVPREPALSRLQDVLGAPKSTFLAVPRHSGLVASYVVPIPIWRIWNLEALNPFDLLLL